MKDALETYIAEIKDFDSKTASELIDCFVYFLTEEHGLNAARPTLVEHCFDLLSIAPYSNVSAYLINQSKTKRGEQPKFIKSPEGYRPSRRLTQAVKQSLSGAPGRDKAIKVLNQLLGKITDEDERSFLDEAILCFHVDARRASVVMVWNLALYHLYRYVLSKKLKAFNAALAQNKDRRIKITAITILDDFGGIPDSKFVELARTARVISNDVRKVLESKLGVRNTYAHPSNLTISEVKAADFIIDLVENVVVKYKV